MTIFSKFFKKLDQNSRLVGDSAMDHLKCLQTLKKLNRGLLKGRKLIRPLRLPRIHSMTIHFSQTTKSIVKIKEVCLQSWENLIVATFTRPNQPSSQQVDTPNGNPKSAWDALRDRARQQNPPPPVQQKEKDVWGEDK
jgi:hypothetical protein